MANRGFKEEKAVNPKQILFMTNPYAAVGVVVGDAGVTADANGKKIIKAGTPLAGDLTARNTAFSAVTSSSGSDAVGVAIHDVDVTDGENNAELLILGFVNLDNLENSVVSLITDDVKAALKGNVTFLR